MASDIDAYAGEFWDWRVRTQPRSSDDIMRVVRPAGWLPEIGPAAVAAHRVQRDAFDVRLKELEADTGRPIPDLVDLRLLRSALHRVTWELDILRVWTHPMAYIDASLGVVYDALLPADRDVSEVGRFLRNVPHVVAVADEVLPGVAQAELADIAITALDGIRDRLAPLADAFPELRDSVSAAAEALDAWRGRLQRLRPTLPPWQPVGREAFDAFLRDIACIPMTADDLMAIGAREYERATVLERLEANRHRDRPPPARLPDVDTQIRQHTADELAVRVFLEAEGLLTQPADLRHYLHVPLPSYLAELSFLGVTDDLTPGRDAISYIPDPSPDLGYFDAANADDPRAGIVHEGVHAQQIALSADHPRPVRRHYYDSAANEGIAFYNEEMMLTAGLFEDAPHTRTVIYNFMRLRALRVTVDVGLATGAMSIAEAEEALRTRVPVDAGTAHEEAVFFAGTPGQAMSYQVGKTQILSLLAEAGVERPDLTLRDLHDSLWRNGNVPIALQRWELLGRLGRPAERRRCAVSRYIVDSPEGLSARAVGFLRGSSRRVDVERGLTGRDLEREIVRVHGGSDGSMESLLHRLQERYAGLSYESGFFQTPVVFAPVCEPDDPHDELENTLCRRNWQSGRCIRQGGRTGRDRARLRGSHRVQQSRFLDRMRCSIPGGGRSG